MEPRLTPALASLRAGFDALSPRRDRRSDGWIGDLAHQGRKSGHNPDDTPGSLPEYTDADSVPDVRGLDVDADLVGPVTMSAAIARILATPADRGRLAYVIWQRRIASRSSGWRWVAYSGADPHTGHAHFSGHPDTDDDGRPWSVATMGDDDMPDAKEIADAVWNRAMTDPVDGKAYTLGNYLRFVEYNVREQLGPVMKKLDALAAVMNGTASADWLRTRFAEIDQRFAEQTRAIGEVPDQVVGELGGMDVDQLVDALAAAGVDLSQLAEAAIERASSGPASSTVGERASDGAGPVELPAFASGGVVPGPTDRVEAAGDGDQGDGEQETASDRARRARGGRGEAR